MTFSIRQATADDFEAWWDLRKRCLAEHPDAFGSTLADALATSIDAARRRFTDTSIAGDNALFIAVGASGNLAGTAGDYRESGGKSEHRMGIWGMYVAPEARGLNVGVRLMNAAIAYAGSVAGVLQVELAVASHNVGARRLYDKMGFRQFGTHPRALLLEGRAIDEDLMVLMLDDNSSTA